MKTNAKPRACNNFPFTGKLLRVGCTGCQQAQICAPLSELREYESNDTALLQVIDQIGTSCKTVENLPSSNYYTTCTIICMNSDSTGSTCSSNCIDCQDTWLCQRIETALNQTNTTAVSSLIQPMQSLCQKILSTAPGITPNLLLIGFLWSIVLK